MYCANVVGNKFCLCQIRCAFKSNGKRVELRPPCVGFSAFFYTFRRIFLCHCRYYRTVKSSAKEHTIGNIAHKLAFNGCFKRIVYSAYRCRIILHGIITHPVACVPACHLTFLAPVIMSRQERFVAFAETFKRLQLAGAIHLTVTVITYIKRNNSYRVSGDEEIVFLFIV